MDTFLVQLHTLLTTPPGNLTYHLVIAFAVVAGLQAIYAAGGTEPREQYRRVRTALLAVLALQLGLFALSGLSWQGVLASFEMLPVLDRAAALLSLLWIAWAWLFPAPNRPGDAFFALLTVSALAFTLYALRFPANIGVYNGAYWDGIWSYAGAGLSALAVLGLLVIQPAGWGIGFGFMILLLGGYLAHLMLPQPPQDYSSWIRLAQLAAYPLLPVLALRLRLPGETAGQLHPRGILDRSYTHELRALQSWLDIAERSPANRRTAQLLRALSYQMGADLCLLIDFALDGETMIEAGYNALTEQDLTPVLLRPNALPVLSAFCLRERPLRLPVNGQFAQDMATLADILHLDSTGSLMSIPLRLSDGRCASLILMAPYRPQRWTLEDQAILVSLAERFSQVILPSEQAIDEIDRPEPDPSESIWQVEQLAPPEPVRVEVLDPSAVSDQDLFQVLTFALARHQELLSQKDIAVRLDAASGLHLSPSQPEQVEWLLWIHTAIRHLADVVPNNCTITIQAGPLESLGDDQEIWLLISIQPPAGPLALRVGNFASSIQTALQPLLSATGGRAQLKTLPGGEPAISVRIPGLVVEEGI